MSIPLRCTRYSNEHSVCNCDCPGYEANAARLKAAIKLLTEYRVEFLDNITARDFLHLRGPSDADMAWLRDYIRRLSFEATPPAAVTPTEG